jgi:hypothetical protein
VNRDPFLRLALIACCVAFALGVAAAGLLVGPTILAAVVLAGLVLAFGLSYEPAPKKPEQDRRRRQRQPAEGTRGFERIE